MNKILKIGTVLLAGFSLVACGESKGAGTYAIPFQTGALDTTTENQKIVDTIDEVYSNSGEKVEDLNAAFDALTASYMKSNMTYSLYSYVKDVGEKETSVTTTYLLSAFGDTDKKYLYCDSILAAQKDDEADEESAYEYLVNSGKAYSRNGGETLKENSDVSGVSGSIDFLSVLEYSYIYYAKGYTVKVKYDDSSKSYTYAGTVEGKKINVTYKLYDGRISYIFYSSYSETKENVVSIAFYNYGATEVPTVSK